MSATVRNTALSAAIREDLSLERDEGRYAARANKDTAFSDFPSVETIESAGALKRSARIFGKPLHREFSVYAMPWTAFPDTQESREFQRGRLRAFLETGAPGFSEPERAQLARNLELAEQFDLLILDSGNLYYQSVLILPERVTPDGKTLIARDAKEKSVRVIRERPEKNRYDSSPSSSLNFQYTHPVKKADGSTGEFFYRYHSELGMMTIHHDDSDSAPVVSLPEIAASLAGLPSLPDDYIHQMEFLDVGDVDLPDSRYAEFDMEDAGEGELIDPAYAVVSLTSYRFKHDGGVLTVQIPAADFEANQKKAQAGFYQVQPEDVTKIVRAVYHLLPRAFLPSKLKIVVLPCTLRKNTGALTINEDTIVVPSLKTKNFAGWFAASFVSVLQHEAAHAFHRDNNAISTLLYRCMMLDGWTMHYGDSSLMEYFAVLAENFFDHPEHRSKFPNGYRLMYALIKMRESGESWNDEKSGAELKALCQGENPFALDVRVSRSKALRSSAVEREKKPDIKKMDSTRKLVADDIAGAKQSSLSFLANNLKSVTKPLTATTRKITPSLTLPLSPAGLPQRPLQAYAPVGMSWMGNFGRFSALSRNFS